MIDKIRKIAEQCIDKNSCEADVRYNEPMNEHTTFKVGGPADCFIQPKNENFISFCIDLLNHAHDAGVPVFILGGGANIVVSDKGFRGIILDTGAWKGHSVIDNELVFKSGTSIDEACEITAGLNLCGFETFAGMPGTIGGAVWMNARCYGRQISDVLDWVEIIINDKSASGNDNYRKKNNYIRKKYIKNKTEFNYKKSPFQKMDCLILYASFNLAKSNKEIIQNEMKKNILDRKEKGHYLFPCAGSAFKNNHEFGKPTGVIIDETGLKGLKKGGAQIAPFHANIIINTGSAAASDIRLLMNEIMETVKNKTGFILEPEVLFIGEWD